MSGFTRYHESFCVDVNVPWMLLMMLLMPASFGQHRCFPPKRFDCSAVTAYARKTGLDIYPQFNGRGSVPCMGLCLCRSLRLVIAIYYLVDPVWMERKRIKGTFLDVLA